MPNSHDMGTGRRGYLRMARCVVYVYGSFAETGCRENKLDDTGEDRRSRKTRADYQS